LVIPDLVQAQTYCYTIPGGGECVQVSSDTDELFCADLEICEYTYAEPIGETRTDADLGGSWRYTLGTDVNTSLWGREENYYLTFGEFRVITNTYEYGYNPLSHEYETNPIGTREQNREGYAIRTDVRSSSLLGLDDDRWSTYEYIGGPWTSEQESGGGGNGYSPPPPPPPPSVNLNGEETVMVPDPIALSWSSSNADSCSASGDWSGGKPTSGSETIKSKTTTADRGDYYYSLSCSGPGGSASDSLNVKVVQVPRCVFTANPENIILPQFSTLAWECEYCIPGTAYINQGIGDVDCSGSQPVRPDKTTSYILSAKGLDGERLFQADVGVGFRPVIREIIPR
jgi:hypothetical protein